MTRKLTTRMRQVLSQKFFKGMLAAGMLICFAACQTEDNLLPNDPRPDMENIQDNEALLSDFAEVLSKVTYNRKDVREFLKAEANKQFDKNYDVLYVLVKDKDINGASFRDILVEYSSEEFMKSIETNLPLLNILIPKISIFNICAENMDCDDPEIPVVVSKEKVTSLYLNGKCEANIEKGEVPDFHTFVVNENSRVRVNPFTRSAQPQVSFISPNYDGTINTNEGAITRSASMTPTEVGSKAVAAYKFFYKDDSSVNSKAFQRDYIYYGITPSNGNGSLNRSATEYISFLEINPSSYFIISDQKTGQSYDDPRISNTTVERKKKGYSTDQLIDRMWTKGAFNFRIEIISSNSAQPVVVYVPLRPDEIWNFNISTSYRHGTWFRKKKYTYRIDPNKFTVKRVNLSSQRISFGKWDLSEEALFRFINFWEEDKSAKYTYSTSHEMTRMTTVKVDGSVKFGLGTKGEGSVDAGVTNSSTVTEKRQFSMERQEEDDALGTTKVYFYDPIIESKVGNNYLVHTYSTGIVTFGLSVI